MRCLDVLSSVAGCFTLPLSKAGQLVKQWIASSSFWAGDGWWAARVIGRESSGSESKLGNPIQILRPLFFFNFVQA